MQGAPLFFNHIIFSIEMINPNPSPAWRDRVRIIISSLVLTKRRSHITAALQQLPHAGTHYPADHSTGNFRTGVTGWRGCKIIRLAVDENRPASHPVYGKTVCKKHGECKSIVSEQWRQIARMVGMLTAAWIIMRHGVRKRIFHIALALRSPVNVKTKNLPMAWIFGTGQAVDFGPNNHA